MLSNISALAASRQLSNTSLSLQQTIKRLTTGRRINAASDDAAGLGIGNKLSMDIKVAAQGQRNANDGVSYLQTADGVLDEVTDLLTRASELAQQARTGTISDSNRTNLDAEFQNILKTIQDIGQNTKFNGQSVFTSNPLAVSMGTFSSVAIAVGTLSDDSSVLGMSTTHTIDTWTTQTYTAASFPAAQAALAAAGSTIGYEAATQAAVSVGGATVANIGSAINCWINDDDAGAQHFANQALLAVNLAVASNPSDLNALATQAAIQYCIDHPPPSHPSSAASNNAGAADAAAAASYTQTTLQTDSTPATSLTTVDHATAAASSLATALDTVSRVRANLGAGMQQMNAMSNALGIQVQNFTAANSQIQDANIADEVVSLTKFQILNQSGTSALGKANQSAQQLLALLQ